MTPKQAKYFKKKGAMSVIDAVRIAYERMPRKFYGSILVEKVIHLTGRYGMYQGTALNLKIDWLTSGAITSDEYDTIPLKKVAEIIGAGHEPSLEYFGITPKAV